MRNLLKGISKLVSGAGKFNCWRWTVAMLWVEQ